MNKGTLKIFGVIGLLVAIFVIWQVIFNDGGALQTAWNGVAKTINDIFQDVTGTSNNIIPQFGDTGATSQGETLDGTTSGF